MGSTLVKELRGTESTRKSMQKLKASAAAPDTRLHNSPPVRLAISHRGVQFINPQTDVRIIIIIITITVTIRFPTFIYAVI